MEGKKEEEMNKKMEKMKGTKAGETSREDMKRQAAYNVSPRGGGGGAMVKSSSGRFHCLCAPTTHPGSFRCRYHRNNTSSKMPRGISVPTNLSMLASSKAPPGVGSVAE